jgi:type VII secretion protein EccE
MMKAQRLFGLNLSWPRLTAVFLIDVGLLALARHWPGSAQTATYAWWTGVGLAALVTIVTLVTVWRTPLISALTARVLDRYVDPQKALASGAMPLTDHQRQFGRDKVGIRERHGQLVSVIAVEGRNETRSGRHYRVASPVTLPVGSIAAGLRQFDVQLDAIDIVSVGALRFDDRGEPQDTNTDNAADEEAPEEEPVPLDHRGTWLVLRMDLHHNAAPVAARDSVAATLAAATERIAQDIDGTQCLARPLTVAEIADVDAAIWGDLQPVDIQPRRHRLRRKKVVSRIGGYVTSFWVSPLDITTQTLSQLWVSGSDAMVTTLRLAPRRDGTQISAWVRYHSSERLRKDAWKGLNRLTGRKLAAVRASLPIPAVRSPLTVPGRQLGDEELEVPVGPASQYPRRQVAAG